MVRRIFIASSTERVPLKAGEGREIVFLSFIEHSPLIAKDIVMELKGMSIPINNKKKLLLNMIIIVRYFGKKLKEF
jgi:hypothetical protein